MGLFGCLLLLPACFFSSRNVSQSPKNKIIPLIHFPADHGNHKGSLTEWWYFNGHLNTDSGKNYSYGFSLFRATALVYFAHVSFTDEKDQQFVFDRIFYPFSKVKFQKNSVGISYGNEQVIEQAGLHTFRLKGKLKNIGIDLVLNIEKAPMLVNGDGKIDMPEGGESFYYSLTRLKTKGVVSIDGTPMPVTGSSWMDHQWGNFYVMDKGWDWFSFQMEDSTEYNLYSFRNSRGRTLKQFVNVLNDQSKISSYREMKILRSSWWENKVTSNKYITAWKLILPGRRDTFFVDANMNNQEIYARKRSDFFPSYWEGRCTVIKKTADGRIVRGQGFAEHFPFGGNKKEK